MFDWLKAIFGQTLPALPSPFTWLSTWLNEAVWLPLRRSFNELRDGVNLIRDQLQLFWTNRAWMMTRMSIKIAHAKEQAIAYLESKIPAIYADISNWVNARIVNITGYFAPIIQQLGIQFGYVFNTLNTFIDGIFASWKYWVETELAGARRLVDLLKSWTNDVASFWYTIYALYRHDLATFLNNPSWYIITLIEYRVAEERNRLARLGAIVLDLIW